MNNTIHPLSPGKPWPRNYLIDILHTALLVKSYRFARQVALSWLTVYEHDLYVRLLRAKALIGEGKQQQSYSILEQICRADPEFLEAQTLRAQLSQDSGSKGGAQALGCAMALGGQLDSQMKLAQPTPAWSHSLRATRIALKNNDFMAAEKEISEALTREPISPLVAVTHLITLWSQSDTPVAAIQSLAEHYHKRWPECVQVLLILADSLMGGGESTKAVTLLHRAAAADPYGQVARRLWGEDHPYQSLWLKDMQATIEVAIPAEVAVALGWNLLVEKSELPEQTVSFEPPLEANPTPEIEEPAQTPKIKTQTEEPTPSPESAPQEAKTPKAEHSPETPLEMDDELRQVAQRLNIPGLTKTDGRHPVYVVFTTRNGLEAKYGAKAAQNIDKAMEKLVLTVRERHDWGSILVYADDPASMAALDLKPRKHDDAYALKLALTDLDEALKKKGALIGAVLIVGGPEVVPYHHLPNPTDDSDMDVPSDNPYATSDENYFVSEWAVGRLPGDSGKNPKLILGGLQEMIKAHAAQKAKTLGWLAFLIDLISRLLPGNRKNAKSFGYTAEVWQRASLSVFRTIGEPRDMITSPPLGSHNQVPEPAAHLGYFNLHGLADAPEWYGQRDPIIDSRPGLTHFEEGPDYPIALRPEDVVNGGRAPKVVFTEACYGTHIFDRKLEESLALKFLNSGTRSVVGSTVIAYGSVSTPLNAADLLGKAFWQYTLEGYPTGEALRRAKIFLAKEMHKRQGYLDGEDQKTLISFVHFGDPLAQASEQTGLKNLSGLRKTAKEVFRYTERPVQVKTVCDRTDSPGTSEPIPIEVMNQVKQVVEQYLPGMDGAHLAMSHEHAECGCEGHSCPTGQLGAKARPDTRPQRKVITMSKEFHDAFHVHPTYARLTIDEKGEVVKVAVSR